MRLVMSSWTLGELTGSDVDQTAKTLYRAYWHGSHPGW